MPNPGFILNLAAGCSRLMQSGKQGSIQRLSITRTHADATGICQVALQAPAVTFDTDLLLINDGGKNIVM
jgi:hypothetical protein